MISFLRNNPHFGKSVLRGESMVNEYVTNASFSPIDEIIADGSVTPVDFVASPPANKYWMITRSLLYLSDATAFSEAEFAGLGVALTNGVELLVDGQVIENWKDNIDIVSSMYDVKSEAFFGKLDKSLHGRWTYAKSEGGPSYGLKVTDAFTVRVSDNILGLTHFHIKVQGEQFDLKAG